jgi:hypothetical protein
MRRKDFRWMLADWLSYFACRLRGHKWFLADSWHGVPGNRASELKQQIWIEAVSQICRYSEDGQFWEYIERLEPKLDELAQLAGANWGHRPNPDDLASRGKAEVAK